MRRRHTTAHRRVMCHVYVSVWLAKWPSATGRCGGMGPSLEILRAQGQLKFRIHSTHTQTTAENELTKTSGRNRRAICVWSAKELAQVNSAQQQNQNSTHIS